MRRKLAYCDHIAIIIKETLDRCYHYEPGPVNLDLHPTKGYFVSTKKTMGCVDENGRKYMITVEEL